MKGTKSPQYRTSRFMATQYGTNTDTKVHVNEGWNKSLIENSGFLGTMWYLASTVSV